MAGTCGRCGAVHDDGGGGEGVPPGWSTSTSRSGIDVLCDRCTRDHVRDIEAKLDETWWT